MSNGALPLCQGRSSWNLGVAISLNYKYGPCHEVRAWISSSSNTIHRSTQTLLYMPLTSPDPPYIFSSTSITPNPLYKPPTLRLKIHKNLQGFIQSSQWAAADTTLRLASKTTKTTKFRRLVCKLFGTWTRGLSPQ